MLNNKTTPRSSLELLTLSRRTFLASIAAGSLASLTALTACSSQDSTVTSSGSAHTEQGSTTSTQIKTDPLAGTAQDKNASTITAVAPDDEFGHGAHHATLIIKDYGTIQLVLDADSAPITVSNFCRLAKDGFYNGLTFHRIIEDFMMQGGDPKGDGTGGADRTIKGEFSANGIDNKLLLTRGTIAMARAQDNDSASSQFFIMQSYQESLDGQYAAFGHVTDGMDVVDEICKQAKPTDSNGSIAKDDQPVIEKLEIDD
ncbi:MAG: peptidylprolyl isomerase [Coriobacteriaceae bacterium]|nr:peptidylprolyl isomerase [Coriobacteriaceae bacterium]